MHDCRQYPGHYDTWRCERCGRHLIILPDGRAGYPRARQEQEQEQEQER